MRPGSALVLFFGGTFALAFVRSLLGLPSPIRDGVAGRLQPLRVPESAYRSVLTEGDETDEDEELTDADEPAELGFSFLLRLLIARGLAHWSYAIPALPAHKHYLCLQPELRAMVRQMMRTLPPTGIYEQDLEMFRAFCRHMVEVFKGAPRSMLLETCNRRLLEACQESEEKMDALLELHALLGISPTAPSWSTSNVSDDCLRSETKGREEEEGREEKGKPAIVLSFLDMIKRKERLEPGRLYLRWSQISEKATKNALKDPNVRRSIRAGLLRKAASTGQVVTEEEISSRLRGLTIQAEKKCTEMVRSAAKLWRDVEKDQEYLNYRRVEELWEFLQCDKYEEQFHSLDKQVGDDRRSRGSNFEERAPIVFGMALERLRRGKRRGAIDDAYCEFSSRRSAIWINRQLKKSVGEIDLMVLGKRRDTGAWEPVAVVEMKSMFYEISLAYCKQHTCKLTDPRNHYIRCALDPSAPDDSAAEEFEIHTPPELFVASLVPDHPYLVGAAKLLMEDVMETFQYNGGCEAVLADEFAARQLMEAIAEKRGLSISPLDMLDRHHEHLLLLS